MINGTFAPHHEYIDIVDAETPGLRKVNKKLFIDGVWEDVQFIIIHDGTTDRGPVQQWLSEHYGPSKYGQTWWPTFNSVCMRDKIYTHYRLCH
jgi:hypothetical protein